MGHQPKRRWLRFSIRTLLVTVTFLAISLAWLAKNLNDVHERQQLLTWISGHDGPVQIEADETEVLPWIRRVLNDHAVKLIRIGNASELTEAEKQRVRAAYPEADVQFEAGDFDPYATNRGAALLPFAEILGSALLPASQ